jgi:hypothetical protein
MIIKLTDNSVKLCCNNKGCPVIEKSDENTFTIKDDYNGTVTLTKDEILGLSQAARELDK